jgi:transcriptional regulator with PAS, ATPase and Fis domain
MELCPSSEQIMENNEKIKIWEKLLNSLKIDEAFEYLNKNEKYIGEYTHILRARMFIQLRKIESALEELEKVNDESYLYCKTRLMAKINYLEGNLEESQKLYLSLVESKSPVDISIGYMGLGSIEFRKGDLKSAINLTLESEKIIRDKEDLLEIKAQIYRKLGIYYGIYSDYFHSLEYHRLSLNCFRELHDLYGLFKEYISFGLSYLQMGEFDHAEFFFNKARAIIEDAKTDEMEMLYYARQGMIEMVRGNLEKSLQYFLSDYKLSLKLGEPASIGYPLRNIGKVYFQMGDIKKAKEYFIESMEKFKKVKDKINYYLTLSEYSKVILKEKDIQKISEIEKEIQKIIREIEGIQSLNIIAQGLIILCGFSIFKGDQKDKELLNKIRECLLKEERKDRLSDALYFLGCLYKERGDTKSAMKLLKEAYLIAREIGRENFARGILQEIGKISTDEVINISYKLLMPSLFVLKSKEVGEITFIGKSRSIKRIIEEAKILAKINEPVLIQGESGTGKELLARYIYYLSPRYGKPFLTLNAGAIPETLIESEFFGYVKGAFTGADKTQDGVFESADSGTVFLDEIGNLPYKGQTALLRFFETGEIMKVGDTRKKKVDVRIISATNEDLKQMVYEGKFRKDLYFRIAVGIIYIPPLRERKEDIEVLVDWCLESIISKISSVKRISKKAMEFLINYDWPGNVRELFNVLKIAALKCKGEVITLDDFPDFLKTPQTLEILTLKEIERKHIEEVLKLCKGNQNTAAKLLGIHRNTLRMKLKEYNLY